MESEPVISHSFDIFDFSNSRQILGNNVKLFQRFIFVGFFGIVFAFLMQSSYATELPENDSVSREELVTKLIGSKYSKTEIDRCGKSYFKDITADNELFGYLCIAKEEGYVSGYEDGNFYPEKPISSTDALNLTYKVLGDEGESKEEFWNGRKILPNELLCNEQNFSSGILDRIISRFEHTDENRDFKDINSVKSCRETFVSPVSNPSCEGYVISRGWSGGHTGIDYVRDEGCWIKAIGRGEVIRAGNCRTLGFCVVIQHENGFQSLYAHGNGDFKVKVGDKVEIGQDIMFMGRTGNANAIHLHFSLSTDKKDVVKYSNRVLPDNLIVL